MTYADKGLVYIYGRSDSANIIEVGDCVQFHENPASRGIIGRRDIFDRTLLKGTIL